MSLTNPSLDKMIGLIRDSFRMRANTQSIYVDIGDNLARIGAQQGASVIKCWSRELKP